MSKLVFEASDFAQWGQEYAHVIAQKIFDAWLAEQPVVFGGPQTNLLKPFERSYSTWKREGDDMTARLVCIEPLNVKCEHEPMFKCEGWEDTGPVNGQYLCKHCGVKLKSTWNEA